MKDLSFESNWVRRIIQTVCFSVIFLFLFCSCAASPAEYVITVKGSALESGVVQYAGLEMNVYADQASNPCGDCPDQPVSIYVGTNAEAVAEAMAEAVTRADDIWKVKSCQNGVLELEEKAEEAGTVKSEPDLSAPKGLELTGVFNS